MKISKLKNFKLSQRRKGMYLPVILMASTLFMAFATAIIILSMSNVKIADLHNKKITSMSIAEAGINYYMWHLAHDSDDYCDGTGVCIGTGPFGPFHHDYTDTSGNSIGTYDLYISPPTIGSNITTVRSVGKVNGKSPTRTIVATIGMPSFTKYTLFANNSELIIPSGLKIEGNIHVNNSGVYNQGEITGDSSSTERTYSSALFGVQDGVSGSGIFGGTRAYPVLAADMNRIDANIRIIRDQTRDLNQGHYYDSLSGSKGYHVILKTTGYDLYKVNRYNTSDFNITGESFLSSHNYPGDGVIYFSDNIWVEGTINDKKITILAADPEANQAQRKRIIIPNSIKYTNYDGRDKIGLITQTDILLARNTPSDMEINAAMIARGGQIKINQYPYEQKSRIKIYGSMMHNGGLLWKYNYPGGLWSGYQTQEIVLDEQSVLDPPPKFPLTGAYSILSWREE